MAGISLEYDDGVEAYWSIPAEHTEVISKMIMAIIGNPDAVVQTRDLRRPDADLPEVS